jgi:hypothetical protein
MADAAMPSQVNAAGHVDGLLRIVGSVGEKPILVASDVDSVP